jgi:hypothetical protein
MNLAFVLKALGIKIAPEQISMIEAVIPQLPAKAVEVVGVVNRALVNFDQRLAALEENQRNLMMVCLQLLEVINVGPDSGDTAIPAGTGEHAVSVINGRTRGNG